jgi:hypothetical protein
LRRRYFCIPAFQFLGVSRNGVSSKPLCRGSIGAAVAICAYSFWKRKAWARIASLVCQLVGIGGALFGMFVVLVQDDALNSIHRCEEINLFSSCSQPFSCWPCQGRRSNCDIGSDHIRQLRNGDRFRLRVKPRDPEASIRMAPRDVRCLRCNGHGRPANFGVGTASVDLNAAIHAKAYHGEIGREATART